MNSTTQRVLVPFTNEHFMAFMKQMAGRPYWYGTCLYKCTDSLLSRKTGQYPSHYGASRTATYKKHIAAREVCADCIGAAKGYAWTNGGQGVMESIGTDRGVESRYGSNGCPDKGTNGMFAYARDKGMPWGAIGTMPEIVGLAVTYSGHVGYYAGNGRVIEFRGFSSGCVETSLSTGKWTHWYMLPFINYGEESADTPAQGGTTGQTTLGSRLLRRGSKGEDVAQLQRILADMGYDLGRYGAGGDGVDGRYGEKTEKAVKRFQTFAQIGVDGKYGSVTHKALMGVLEDSQKGEDGGDTPDESAPGTPAGKQVLVTGDNVNVRSGPATTYKVLTRVNKGDALPYVATAEAAPWHAVELGGKIGWISGKYADVREG